MIVVVSSLGPMSASGLGGGGGGLTRFIILGTGFPNPVEQASNPNKK